jgi:hypothetical protein
LVVIVVGRLTLNSYVAPATSGHEKPVRLVRTELDVNVAVAASTFVLRDRVDVATHDGDAAVPKLVYQSPVALST